MFIGRAKEIKQLQQVSNNNIANLVVIRGRRRIGKTRLIEQFSNGKNFYRFIVKRRKTQSLMSGI